VASRSAGWRRETTKGAPPGESPLGLTSTGGSVTPANVKLLGRVLSILSQKNSSSLSAGRYRYRIEIVGDHTNWSHLKALIINRES
jgi:hypothetical protein